MKEYCVSPTTSLLECFRTIDCSATGIALAVDEKFRLIGTISDGDVRRALLRGHDLGDQVGPHINRDCFWVSADVRRDEVLDIMQVRRFEQVPILDKTRKVIGLHLLHDIMGGIERPNWAVVMAGGQGKRLQPLTEKVPKPMLKVAGRPILERTVLHLVGYGIHHIFLAVNYLRHVIEDHFEDGSRFGCSIQYLREEEPLGSGGAVSLLPQMPVFPLLVMNGDLIVDVDFHSMLEYHSQNGFYATVGVHPYFHMVPYGCVQTEDGTVSALEEKPLIEKTVNAGIYVLSPEAAANVPKDTFFPMTDLLEDAIEKGFTCGAHTIEKEWIDIGNPKQLKRAREGLEEEKALPSV